MADDVDMDAPQISTLREETTPEPNPTKSKFRVKLVVHEKAEGSRAGSTTTKHGRAESDEDDDDDDEEEEDQLIDDDDDEVQVAKPLPPAPPPVPPPPQRGVPGKRGGRGRGGGRRGRGGGRAGAPVVQDVRPESWDPAATPDPGPSAQPPVRKKPGPPKGTPRAIRKKASKHSVAKSAVAYLKDDADSVSEAYAGTAASSPMPHEGSPEPDISMSTSFAPPPPLDDTPLDGVPLPVYPLPSKPFPVQPPPKIASGFAPAIILDKSGKSVRRWRQVNREVRGIAGGRWFVKSWVGEKESEYATAVAASQAAAQITAVDGISAAGLSLPKLSSVSITGSGRGRGRGAKHGIDHSSVTSRAGSAMPESMSAHLAMSRMRGSGPSTPSVDLPTTPLTAPPPTH